MKIVRNTSPYCTRDVKRVVVAVHRQMKRLEARPAPNWKNLRLCIRTRSSGVSGWAYFHGHGDHKWDVHLSLPRSGLSEQRLAWLAYHELMHTYGYSHRQYTDAKPEELAQWFPSNAPMKLKTKKSKRVVPIQDVRHARVAAQLKSWTTKAKRAETAMRKLRAKLRYYERQAEKRASAET